MAVTNTVTIDGTDYIVLPGTFKYRALPDTVRRHNEPRVVYGVHNECEFETDEDNIGSLVSSGQGSGSHTVEISGFESIYGATIDVYKIGQGIQKSRVICRGTKQAST